jgi:hypothetical protein
MKRIGLVQGALRLDTGTSIEPFGDRAFAVKQVPEALAKADPAALF